jgi:DNA-binding SARP family transcriptional activator/tetratricopeptide (TPR) repeat protein/DNA-binding XRE family transcriptional regulator
LADARVDLAEQLRQARQQAGLTQRELADRTGISAAAIRDLEQGRSFHPRPSTLRAIATVLDLGPAQLADLRHAAHGVSPRPSSQDGMRVAVLGPLQLHDGEAPVLLGSGRHRVVLAKLALNPHRAVQRDELAQALWGEKVPPSAVSLIQTYVSRLRRMLDPAQGPGERETLTFTQGGYQLNLGGDRLDLVRFGTLVNEAERAGDAHAAFTALTEALDLWRGAPLPEIEELQGDPAVIALSEAWVTATIRYARLAETLVRLEQVLPRLRGLAARFPLHEPLQARFVTALAATGRQAAALEAYQEIRRRLAEDLGIDPGPELIEVHRDVLRQRWSRPPPSEAGDAADPHSQAPVQLPPDLAGFAGRAGELAVLAEALGRGGSPAASAPIVVLSGTAGVGKTTLAVHLAHRIRDAYPDGQLYLDLRGFSPGGALDPHDALHTLLLGVGAAPTLIPADREARLGLYRSLLSGRRVLVVLDNAGSAEQVRPLLPPSPAAAALVTSRSPLSGLVVTHGSQPIELALLDDRAAREILIARLGRPRVEAEPDAARAIIARCAGLPLALAVVSGHAVAHERQRLADIVHQLGQTRNGLSVALDSDPATDLHTVFSWSYIHLSAPAARMFRTMSLIPNGQLSSAAAQDLANIGPQDLRPALNELVNAGLLRELDADRFSVHDLLLAYSAELAARHDRPSERAVARLRLYQHYHETAWHAGRLLYPNDKLDRTCAFPAVRAPLHTEDDARQWLAAERTNLVHAIVDAADRGWNQLALALCRAVVFYLDRSGHPHDGVRVIERCLPLAAITGDDRESAFLHRCLAFAYISAGRLDDAEKHLHQSLELHERIADERGLGNTMIGFVHLYNRRGDYAAVRAAAQAANDIYTRIGAMDWVAGSLNSIAWAELNLGELDTAMRHCREALDLLETAGAGDTTHSAGAWDTYGVALHRVGRYRPAREAFRRAIEIYRRKPAASRLAATLDHLGDCEAGLGDECAALSAYQEALVLVEAIEPVLAGQLRAKLGVGVAGGNRPNA